MARVLVPLADGCEELEAVTVIDLLRRAGVEVVAAGLEPGPVMASREVTFIPESVLEEVLDETFDMIVLPGGAGGAKELAADDRVKSLLQRHAESGKITAAICAAPSVLAGAGLLAGKSATSFPGWLDDAADVEHSESPVVIDGRIVTSRGPGTAMDFALRLIGLLVGEDKAAEVESKLQRPEAHRLFN